MRVRNNLLFVLNDNQELVEWVDFTAVPITANNLPQRPDVIKDKVSDFVGSKITNLLSDVTSHGATARTAIP